MYNNPASRIVRKRANGWATVFTLGLLTLGLLACIYVLVGFPAEAQQGGAASGQHSAISGPVSGPDINSTTEFASAATQAQGQNQANPALPDAPTPTGVPPAPSAAAVPAPAAADDLPAVTRSGVQRDPGPSSCPASAPGCPFTWSPPHPWSKQQRRRKQPRRRRPQPHGQRHGQRHKPQNRKPS